MNWKTLLSLHEQVLTDINLMIDGKNGVSHISPTTIAQALADEWADDDTDPRITYLSIEHLKQLARRALRGRFDTESDGASADQGELFSGELQRRYPTPHAPGDDPAYVLLELLTPDEIRWNVDSLRKSADARLKHARALEAFGERQRLAA